MGESLKHAADLGGFALVMGVLMGVLPQIAAILTVGWLAMRLWNEIMTAVYRRRDRQIGTSAQSVRLSSKAPSQE